MLDLILQLLQRSRLRLCRLLWQIAFFAPTVKVVLQTVLVLGGSARTLAVVVVWTPMDSCGLMA